MMTIDTTYSLYALLVSNVMLLAAATISILRFQRQLRSSAEFWDSPTGPALKAQSDRYAISQLVEKCLSILQEATEEIARREGVAQCRPAEKLPIDNAMRMAKQGASVEELTRNCGLNKGEAQLLLRVHGCSSLQ